MMSRAGEKIGQGWAFGLHEAMDQTGAMVGPLIAALVLAQHHDYRAAFAWLGVPALLTVATVVSLSLRYPYAGRVRPVEKGAAGDGLSRAFWLYTASAALFAFGFADYSLIAYHYAKAQIVSPTLVPILYAGAMGMAGLGSLLFGRWFDKRGLLVLVPGLAMAAVAPALAFLGGFVLAIIGALLWGLALGAQDVIMSAAIADLVPEQNRARAYGLSAIYGVAWFAGSALLGALYDVRWWDWLFVAALAQLLAVIPSVLAIRARSAR